MGELTNFILCPSCGKECPHWPDGSFKCDTCGRQGVFQFPELCPICGHKALTDAYDNCQWCGQNRFDVDENDPRFKVMKSKEEAEVYSENIRNTGKLGEDYAAKNFQIKGYEVGNITYWDTTVCNLVLDYVVIEKLLEGNRKKKVVIKLFEEQRWLRGIPDFVLRKDGRVSFCEVKANGADLKPPQRELLAKLKALGFEVSVMWVSVLGGKADRIIKTRVVREDGRYE